LNANLVEILQSLISRPRETLTIELKSWFDPNTPEGERKIARAALALRNQNGGFLVIGFNDKTCQPDPLRAGENVRVTYHADVIQRIVSKYASPSFVVEVHFPETGGVTYPVIEIPAGVKAPVVCKASLSVKDQDGKEDSCCEKRKFTFAPLLRTAQSARLRATATISKN
jgi:predicted HTH transcriptional regulator